MLGYRLKRFFANQATVTGIIFDIQTKSKLKATYQQILETAQVVLPAHYKYRTIVLEEFKPRLETLNSTITDEEMRLKLFKKPGMFDGSFEEALIEANSELELIKEIAAQKAWEPLEVKLNGDSQ